MSLTTWEQLRAMESAIKGAFKNGEDPPKESCPAQKRVHLLYAHYLARPKVEKNVPPYTTTITLYGQCSSAHQEPTYQKAALGFLAAHYLWVRLPGVEITALPTPKQGPPTLFAIPKTAIDGGTLIHFKNTNCDETTEIKATVKTPLMIKDRKFDYRAFIDKYGDKVPEVAHPHAAHPLDEDDPIVGPAYPYLSDWTTAQRQKLLDAQNQLGLPVQNGALPGVMQHESGGDPRQPFLASGTPRAGLIQVTQGAGLPGFKSAQQVWDGRNLTVEEQIDQMVIPHWQGMPAARRATVGAKGALRFGFLPYVKEQSPSYVLAVAPGKVGPGGETPDSKVGGISRGSLYSNNGSFDPTFGTPNARGYYTWQDVDDSMAASEAAAGGKWITVSGVIVDSYGPHRKRLPPPPPQSAPNRALGDVDASPAYPKKRVLCLSQMGSVGDHKLVDAFPPSDATVDLAYHTLSQDSVLRLFCVAPGFVFEQSGSAGAAREALDVKPADIGADPKQRELLDWLKGDPWFTWTRNLGSGKQLWETSSHVLLGDLVKSHLGEGLQKLSSAPGVTTTEILGQRYYDQIGRSRQVVFEVLKDVLGACESLQTWADNNACWGINWWRLDNADEGELTQILAYIYDFYPDAFARRFGYFGIGAWFSGRKATWEPRNTYQDAILYRVPCCGPDICKATKAVLEDSLEAKGRHGDDTPPIAMKPLADAMRLRRLDTTSEAFCYVLTTAGEDRDVQRAMAQWMSFRISSKGPVGKKLLVVVEEFVETLRPTADKAIHEIRAVLGLGADYAAGKTTQSQALAAYADTAQREASARLPKGAGESDAAHEKRVQELVAKAYPLGETFSDEDADLGWIDWPQRCRDANKHVEGVEKQAVNVARTERKASVFKGAGDLAPTKEA